MSRRQLAIRVVPVVLLIALAAVVIHYTRSSRGASSGQPLTYRQEMEALTERYAPMHRQIDEAMRRGDSQEADRLVAAIEAQRIAEVTEIRRRHGKLPFTEVLPKPSR